MSYKVGLSHRILSACSADSGLHEESGVSYSSKGLLARYKQTHASRMHAKEPAHRAASNHLQSVGHIGMHVGAFTLWLPYP